MSKLVFPRKTMVTRDATPYRILTRILRGEARDYTGAADILQRALVHARLDHASREAMVRELAEVYLYFLNAPGRAAVLLAKYIADNQPKRDVKWAREMLKAAKERC